MFPFCGMFFSQFLLIVLNIKGVLSLHEVVSVSKVLHTYLQVSDFGYGWKAIGQSNNQLTFLISNGTNTTRTVCQGTTNLQAKVNLSAGTARFLKIPDFNPKSLYIYENSTISQKSPTFPGVDKAIFLSEDFILAAKPATKQVMKISLSSMAVQLSYANLKYNSSFFLGGNANKIGVVSVGPYTNSTLTIFDGNLAMLAEIQFPYQPESSLEYCQYRDYFVRCSQYMVRVYDSSLTLLKQFNVAQIQNDCPLAVAARSSYFTTAKICNNLLLVSFDPTVVIYDTDTWAVVNCMQPQSTTILNKLNCYEGRSMFGVHYINSLGYIFIEEFSINYTYVPNVPNATNITNSTSPINSTNSTNSTNTINSTYLTNTNQTNTTNTTNITSTTADPIEIPSTSPPPHTIVESVSSLIRSPQIKSIAEPTSTAIGICASSPLTMHFIRPLMSLLTDLWFYGFHVRKYGQFIQLFTNQIDIWNQIRTRSQFFQKPTIAANEHQNSLYVSTNYLHKRAPDSVFMLLSIQDVYVFSAAICVSQWVLNVVMRYILRIIRHESRSLAKIYKKVLVSTLWWSFLIVIIQPNISQVAFYGTVQFHCFYFFSPFGKVNLVITSVLVFVVLIYSFSIFLMIRRFDRTRRHKAYQFCKKKSNVRCMILETSLRGLRSFLQAFVHGMLINNNAPQLAGLVILDIMCLALIVRLRHSFKERIAIILNFLYYLSFLGFDILLNILVRLQAGQVADAQSMYVYELSSMIIILSMIGVTILKTIIEIIKVITSILKFIKGKILKSNKQKEVKKNDKNFCSIKNKISPQKLQQEKKSRLKVKIKIQEIQPQIFRPQLQFLSQKIHSKKQSRTKY